jgi:hypothetical protein
MVKAVIFPHEKAGEHGSVGFPLRLAEAEVRSDALSGVNFPG